GENETAARCLGRPDRSRQHEAIVVINGASQPSCIGFRVPVPWTARMVFSSTAVYRPAVVRHLERSRGAAEVLIVKVCLARQKNETDLILILPHHLIQTVGYTNQIGIDRNPRRALVGALWIGEDPGIGQN